MTMLTTWLVLEVIEMAERAHSRDSSINHVARGSASAVIKMWRTWLNPAERTSLGSLSWQCCLWARGQSKICMAFLFDLWPAKKSHCSRDRYVMHCCLFTTNFAILHLTFFLHSWTPSKATVLLYECSLIQSTPKEEQIYWEEGTRICWLVVVEMLQPE